MVESRESKVESRKVASRFTLRVSRLLNWFAANARDLPWRRTLDPYAVWVSEIMLQQTQVKTVIPYFERWMRELPDVQSLASASSEKIHKLWEGLGYYTRVRNMQKAAQVIVKQYHSKFSTNFDDVLALPGIGRYTAGAICSIAFNQPTPILDGNVMRVLTRVFGIRENVREKETNARLWRLAEELVATATPASLSMRASDSSARPSPPLGVEERVPEGRERRFGVSEPLVSGPSSALNQSLMELGALVCSPRHPKCEVCPLAELCVARRKNLIEQIPNLGERVSATARRFVTCVIERDGKFLVRQRPAGIVNAHLWEFPNAEVGLDASRRTARKNLERETGVTFATFAPLATVKHTITRYRITLNAFRGELNGAMPLERAGHWVPAAQLEALPFTSAHRRVLGVVLQNASETLAAR